MLDLDAFWVLLAFGVAAAVAVLVASLWTGEGWRQLLAVCAPVAGIAWALGYDRVGAAVVLGWSLLLLITMAWLRLSKARERRSP